MRKAGAGLVVAVTLVACSSDDDFTCSVGALRGTWRVSYVETNGNCGPLADETVSLDPSSTPKQSLCTFANNQTSPDRCRSEQDFTCPLAGAAKGSQRWVGVLTQDRRDRLVGSFTLQTTGDIVCRSTYSVSWTKL